jgi:hypothetical protein
MKKKLFSFIILLLSLTAKAQITPLAGDYKFIDIGWNGHGDYTRCLILLHEIYNGNDINHNYAIGTLTAMRGSMYTLDRLNVVEINTSSSYRQTKGSLTAYDDDYYQNGIVWKLKTCLYNGKKYLAAEVPYGDSGHEWGFKFFGATSSTGENMKCVSYEVSGQPVNQNLISDIQDYSTSMIETHDVAKVIVTGKVGIGTKNVSNDMLTVNGSIRSKEVKVEIQNWPDYVFNPAYELPSLREVKTYIDLNHRLPEIPSENQIAEKGLRLGEMNKLLLKKVEELTLYLIEKDRQVESQNEEMSKMQGEIHHLQKIMELHLQEFDKNTIKKGH